MLDEDLMKWILGGLGTFAVLLFGYWWKVEERQDKKIDALGVKNDLAHRRLHTKIDATQAELTRQHMQLRDKIEDIWKHVVKSK